MVSLFIISQVLLPREQIPLNLLTTRLTMTFS